MAEDGVRREDVENLLKKAATVRASAAEAVLRARKSRERAAAALDHLQREQRPK